MIVEWTITAQNELHHIILYIIEIFGKKAGLELVADIEKTNRLLASNPEIGHLEPLLAGRLKKYRCLIIHKNCKLIYYIDDDVIYVSDLWDTRRSPQKLKQRIRRSRQ